MCKDIRNSNHPYDELLFLQFSMISSYIFEFESIFCNHFLCLQSLTYIRNI